MAVDGNKIDKEFRQQGNSCLLASFSITGRYFLNEPIESFFKDYFSHFEPEMIQANIEYTWPGFQTVQGCHINYYTQRFSKSGYKVLLEDLYLQSKSEVFNRCRQSFNCEIISIDSEGYILTGALSGRQINKVLEEEEAILNIFLNQIQPNDKTLWRNIASGHSITVYFDEKFYCHDTNNPTFDLDIDSSWQWWQYYRLGDKMISWR